MLPYVFKTEMYDTFVNMSRPRSQPIVRGPQCQNCDKSKKTLLCSNVDSVKNSPNKFLNCHIVSIYYELELPNSKLTKLVQKMSLKKAKKTLFCQNIDFFKNSKNTFLNCHIVSIYSQLQVPNSKMTKLVQKCPKKV